MKEDSKKTFARAILAGKNTFEAAALAMGQNHPDLFNIASTWPSDLDVLRYQEVLQAEVSKQITRTGFADLAYDKLKRAEGSDFAAIAKVFIPFMGWSESENSKPKTTYKILNTAGKSAKELEEEFVKQQRDLVPSKSKMFSK